jgi:hypothetical protein
MLRSILIGVDTTESSIAAERLGVDPHVVERESGSDLLLSLMVPLTSLREEGRRSVARMTLSSDLF